MLATAHQAEPLSKGDDDPGPHTGAAKAQPRAPQHPVIDRMGACARSSMDRATGFYPVGWGFESLRAHKVVAPQHVFSDDFSIDRNADRNADSLRIRATQV